MKYSHLKSSQNHFRTLILLFKSIFHYESLIAVCRKHTLKDLQYDNFFYHNTVFNDTADWSSIIFDSQHFFSHVFWLNAKTDAHFRRWMDHNEFGCCSYLFGIKSVGDIFQSINYRFRIFLHQRLLTIELSAVIWNDKFK